MNDSGNRNEKELLEELVLLQKKSSRRSMAAVMIAAACALILLIASVIIVPQLSRVLTTADEVAVEAETAMNSVNNIVKNADELLQDNTETVASVMQKIEQIDFDSLNSSIKSLSDILEPIAKITGVFK